MEGKAVSVSRPPDDEARHGQGHVLPICRTLPAASSCISKIDEMDEATFERCRKLDIGDIVGVHGDVFRTQRGEISVRAHEVVAAFQGSAAPAR